MAIATRIHGKNHSDDGGGGDDDDDGGGDGDADFGEVVGGGPHPLDIQTIGPQPLE